MAALYIKAALAHTAARAGKFVLGLIGTAIDQVGRK